MKKKFKDIWTKALDSAEYVQGQENLCIPGKNNDKFCCLGVLLNETGEVWAEDDFGDGLLLPTKNTDYSKLDEDRLRKFGITPEQQETLIKMNDGYCGDRDAWTGEITTEPVKKHTFKQISAWIKKNL